MLQRWRRTRRRWGTRHLSSCWPWHRRLRRCCWRFWARWWWVAEMRCLCKSLYHDIGNLLTLSFHWSCFPVQTMRTTRRSMVSGNFVVCLSPLFTLTSHVRPNAFFSPLQCCYRRRWGRRRRARCKEAEDFSLRSSRFDERCKSLFCMSTFLVIYSHGYHLIMYQVEIHQYI